MPERLECEVPQKARYINTLTYKKVDSAKYSFSNRLAGLNEWKNAVALW